MEGHLLQGFIGNFSFSFHLGQGGGGMMLSQHLTIQGHNWELGLTHLTPNQSLSPKFFFNFFVCAVRLL